MRNLMRVTLAAALTASALVAVAADDVLTPMGAIRTGSADGSIPAWTGGLDPQTPVSDDGRLVDPFSADRPLFTVTAQTFKSYADKLSAGHKALFAKYPDYRLPVYPTRRSVGFPQAIYQATAENQAKAQLVGVDAIAGAHLAIPFPRPRSGIEVLWNHRLRYHGDAQQWWHHQVVQYPDGARIDSKAVERLLFRYANLTHPAGLNDEGRHSLTALRLTPAETYSSIAMLWHDPVNALTKGRNFWYEGTTGQIRRAPTFGHDDVGLFSNRLRYMDQLDMFNGAFDRYTFKLMGKRPMIVPYNSFRLSRTRNAKLLKPGHIDQSQARYELHRVWVVDATLRPGIGHPISRRVFYVDEDSWSILLVDCYDRDGKLWRVQEGHLLPIYTVQGVDYTPLLVYDLKDGRYVATRLIGDERAPDFKATFSPNDFTPAALKTASWR